MKNIITDFGAVPNTDCTSAFQAAANSGETVSIPSNIYTVSNSCTLFSRTKFIGEPGAKIVNTSPTPLFNISADDVDIDNIEFDDSASTEKDVLIKSSVGNLKNINLRNLSSNKTKGFIVDEPSTNFIKSLNIENIRSNGSSGRVISLNSPIDKCSINNISIDYIGSSSPDNPAITVDQTSIYTGGLILTNASIQGSDALGLPNQHGIVIGSSEHYLLDNCNIISMGGKGLWCKNTINFHASSINASFCVGNQMQLDNCGFSTMTNCMARGRANGILSFLVNSTYGLYVNGGGNISVSNSNFKSAGAGVWLNGVSNLCFANCGYSINYYYGLISTGTNTSIICSSSFFGNGLLDGIHSSSGQYVRDCLTSAGIRDFTGIGNF